VYVFVIQELAVHGKKGFYEGRIAQAICEAVSKFGGVMSLDDLKNHVTTFEEPIKTSYKGHNVWEIPPNGQGITALMALNILEDFNLKGNAHSTFSLS
jgi:gamma-glutamyltranspeptidase/glutathione hydrolase